MNYTQWRMENKAETLPLTDREREIAWLAADGKPAAQIGLALNIAASTVKVHLHSIYTKLGITGPRAAIMLAARSRELLGKRG